MLINIDTNRNPQSLSERTSAVKNESASKRQTLVSNINNFASTTFGFWFKQSDNKKINSISKKPIIFIKKGSEKVIKINLQPTNEFLFEIM